MPTPEVYPGPQGNKTWSHPHTGGQLCDTGTHRNAFLYFVYLVNSYSSFKTLLASTSESLSYTSQMNPYPSLSPLAFCIPHCSVLSVHVSVLLAFILTTLYLLEERGCGESFIHETSKPSGQVSLPSSSPLFAFWL